MRAFEPFSIYSKRLAKSGDLITHNSDRAVLTLLQTSDLVETDFTSVRLDDTLGDLVKAVARSTRNLYPVLDDAGLDDAGVYRGYIGLDDIRKIMFDKDQYETTKVYTLMKNAPATVLSTDRMDSVMDKFDTTKAWNLPVVDEDGRYVGYVSKSKIFSSYRQRLQDVSCD